MSNNFRPPGNWQQRIRVRQGMKAERVCVTKNKTDSTPKSWTELRPSQWILLNFLAASGDPSLTFEWKPLIVCSTHLSMLHPILEVAVVSRPVPEHHFTLNIKRSAQDRTTMCNAYSSFLFSNLAVFCMLKTCNCPPSSESLSAPRRHV